MGRSISCAPRSIVMEREIDMRYTMQLAEVATPMPDGSLTSTEIAGVAEAFEKKYADLYGKDSGFREAGIQAITYRVRGTGVLPFSPELPELAVMGVIPGPELLDHRQRLLHVAIAVALIEPRFHPVELGFALAIPDIHRLQGF